jgi:hypothetical protein
MLYQPTEIKTSEKQLQTIFKKLKGQTCLLGGWAVYHLVNKNFEKATGRKYVGSRDIDIGFHIDKKWTEEQLINSEFATAIKTLEKLHHSCRLQTNKRLQHRQRKRTHPRRISKTSTIPNLPAIHRPNR